MFTSAHPCKVIATSGSHLCSLGGGQGDRGGVVLSTLGAGQSQLIARCRLNASLIATAAMGRAADLRGRPKQHVCLDASGRCHSAGLQQSQHIPKGLYKGGTHDVHPGCAQVQRVAVLYSSFTAKTTSFNSFFSSCEMPRLALRPAFAGKRASD